MRLNVVVFSLLVCALFGVTFVSAEVNVSATSVEIPNLIGNWSGTSEGYVMDYGFYGPEDNYNYVLSIPEQQGQVFKGTIDCTGKDYNATFKFSGVIDHDMKTLYFAENKTGVDIAHLVSADEIELIGLDEEGSVALLSLKKET